MSDAWASLAMFSIVLSGTVLDANVKTIDDNDVLQFLQKFPERYIHQQNCSWKKDTSGRTSIEMASANFWRRLPRVLKNCIHTPEPEKPVNENM